SVASSLMIVSTQKTSTEFDHARVTVDSAYLTAGATANATATGVSSSGNAADVPAEAVWAISDEKVATIDENGVIQALAAGDAEVRLLLNDKVVGKRTIHVVKMPNSLVFEKTNMHLIYGMPTELPLKATYNGNPVEITPDDIRFTFSPSNAGSMDGFSFTGDEASGIRNVTVTASLRRDATVSASIELSLYSNGEAIFDFDSATSGDTQFAWLRDVNNATTEDEKYYHISDPNQAIDVTYIFALDIESVPVPDKLTPLLSIVAGGDVSGVSPWKLLLQLAERVNTMTNVKVTMDLDPNLDFDVSNILFVNDYFKLTDAEIDEENHKLTVTINFIKQSEPIDEATANSICIVSGIKGTPKADAAWDENHCLQITNSGSLKYDIYLRAGALYSFSSDPANQETYGLYPFVDTEINPTYGTYDMGGHFMQDYASFEDSFTIDASVFDGWKEIGSDLYYFSNNQAVTGIQLVPGYEDASKKYYYDFGEDGVSRGKVNGLFTLEDGLHYAVLGEPKTGWRTISESGSQVDYYYFNPKTGVAVDGEQTITGYHYLFEDYKLIRGDLVKDEVGSRYRWADFWLKGKWFEYKGGKYYVKYNTKGYVYADGLHEVRSYTGGNKTTYLF
ncbi:MAG: Ig-like domain-containing protein, partial [Lachnospiraceae bacterium]|nr:Ig-like domain-containing protein [Lachnospiraceae bacterium]